MRRARSDAGRAAAISGEELLAAVRRHPDRSAATRSAELPLMVDRERARFGAWYELFPRSQGRDPGRPVATTFDDATWRLPEIARLGFDVVYLPPIHPIGRTNRKGANNTLKAKAGDPGSPYAIGSAEGGHDAVASELGGLEALLRFREAVEAQGMELALDLAIQASPDHPWVRDHPGWFRHAPDGTIKFAENPPKKYQDIYPIEFGNDDPEQRMALWTAWRDIVLTWVERGIRIFRVDNPHTKPIPFWRWLIADVQREHPDVIFLSEAFTRPKMMQQLAKIGFTQSYTYFTWRETRDELREYFTELTQTQMREYFRPNLFTNTPDINPHHLDHGRPAFVIRSVLAATLGSSYGIYSGWELCENARLEDREEYRDSEKYEIRARDWDAAGNIKPLIGSTQPRSARVAGTAAERQPALPVRQRRADDLLPQGNAGRATGPADRIPVSLDRAGVRGGQLRPHQRRARHPAPRPARRGDRLGGAVRDGRSGERQGPPRARRRRAGRPGPAGGAVPHLHGASGRVGSSGEQSAQAAR